MGKSKSLNQKCSCGSGRKAKQCCRGRKPRSTSVTFEFHEPVELSGISISSGGRVLPLVQGQPTTPKNASIESMYDRPKGPKVLNHVPVSPTLISQDINHELAKKYRLFAVDTNTKQIRGDMVSVTCITMCEFVSQHSEITARYGSIACIEFRNLQGSVENSAWRVVIELLRVNPEFRPDREIGIVVDSDLGAIPAYNARERPIHGDFYLPQGFELIYGSSDVGKEYLPNLLLSRSDNEARQLLKLIESDPSHDQGRAVCTLVACSGVRHWYPAAKKG